MLLKDGDNHSFSFLLFVLLHRQFFFNVAHTWYSLSSSTTFASVVIPSLLFVPNNNNNTHARNILILHPIISNAFYFLWYVTWPQAIALLHSAFTCGLQLRNMVSLSPIVTLLLLLIDCTANIVCKKMLSRRNSCCEVHLK